MKYEKGIRRRSKRRKGEEEEEYLQNASSFISLVVSIESWSAITTTRKPPALISRIPHNRMAFPLGIKLHLVPMKFFPYDATSLKAKEI